ncbi:response regulator [Sandaracinus amylolyticus]|uniref:response regulator n=1 Tax=Sandaracinus amylolyticus TaxID=927083 RepID=UPI001EFF7B3F|nr:response regulator [Sandaracinus amylolyticus]UJR82360.1 Hypothetical protein I5071_44250 [Sandaracinus amylolyticus]
MTIRTILVVDDEEGVRTTLAANLELEGFQVVEADGVASAVAALDRADVSLVLSDIRMPGESGIDLLRRVRAMRPGLPVVLMTAFTAEELIADAVDGGVFAVLPKPFDLERACTVLTRALRLPMVLVVDDVRDDAEQIAVALRESGLRASAAHGGREAITILESADVDVCVTDLRLREMDGLELVARVRALDPRIAVITLCADDTGALVRQAFARGAFGCFREPVAARELMRAIARARASEPRGPR